MGHSIATTVLFLCLILAKSLADVSSLQDQSQDHLDPARDQDQDLSDNNQEKRTICSALNKCSGTSLPTSSYVRRLVIKGVRPQIVGYAPVVKPVAVRQVVLAGYKYPKPKFQLALKPPSAVHGGWKPVHTATKPVVEVVKPSNHIDVIHNNPVPHVDHVAPTQSTPVHVDHVHVQPSFVHLKPVAFPSAHVDQIHQVSVPHGNHFDTFTHVDHLQPAAVPVAQPVVPVAPPPAIVKPFGPSPVLFEVTRPNLGVLPLGARFPSHILKEFPHVHHFGSFASAPFPVAPAVPTVHAHPLQHHHHHVQAVQGIIHTPVGLPHIQPQPGVSVEYHGTRNYLPFSGSVPVSSVQHFPHQDVNLAALHPHQHLPFQHAAHGFAVEQQQQQQLPFQHAAHGFAVEQQQQLPFQHAAHGFALEQQQQQQLPFQHASHGFAAPQQALPHEHQAQFLTQEQQLPHQTSGASFQQQLQAIQQYQEIPQGQLPLEGEQNSLNVQNFDHNNVIQPGQTDVQIPYHLPQHGGWAGAQSGGLQEESRGFGEQVFRPSQQLEAPYQK